MKKKIELPLTEPMYSTYHHQGPATAIGVGNSAGKIWALNNAVNLFCNRKFLTGFTTPELGVERSSWADMPCIEKEFMPTRFAGGYINPIIRNMLDKGF